MQGQELYINTHRQAIGNAHDMRTGRSRSGFSAIALYKIGVISKHKAEFMIRKVRKSDR